MAGLLYGSRSGLPVDLMENFNRSGITHIIAISGYNITIIVLILMTVLIFFGFYRRQAFWITVGMIFIFVIFTGASPSVTRAAIMGTIVLLAQYFGRISSPLNLLTLAMALMLIFNPQVLWWDAGFQLSFLATIGLLYLSPLLLNTKEGLKTTISLKETLSATMSAIILTLPLMLYQFERLSIVAPITNILILWLIPWLMLLGFLSVIISFIFFPAGQIIAWLSGFGLDYVIMMAEWFGSKRWSAIDFSLPWWGMLGGYAFLLIFIVLWRRKIIR